MTDVTLKPATEKDIDLFLEIERSVDDSRTFSATTTKEEAEEEFKSNKIFFIENKGEVAGLISYEPKSQDSVYLSDFIVLPKLQGRGIGREALKQILDELKWAKRIYFVTHPDNVRGLALYKSFGFQVEDRKENYFGDGEPRLVMARINSRATI